MVGKTAAENLYVVPERVKNEESVFTEPLAAALEIQHQVHVRPGDRVMLVGAGRLGQIIAQTFRCGPFPAALKLLEAGKLDLNPLIDSRYAWMAALDAFERAGHPDVMKVLLQPA